MQGDGASELGAQSLVETPGTALNVTPYVVTGTVSSPTSASVGRITVRLVDKNVGGDAVLVEGRTDLDGSFTLTAGLSPATLAARNKTSPDLQVQAMQGDAVLASSIVRYNASPTEVLEVVLAATAVLASEYDSLAGDLAALYPGSLAELEESDTRQDVTYLANKSGWDARAVAMISLATQFSQASAPVTPAPIATNGKGARRTRATRGAAAAGAAPAAALAAASAAAAAGAAAGTPSAAAAASPPALQPAHYYALMRSGLPTDPAALHQASPDLAVAVWQGAASQNVIPSSLGDDTDAAREAFIGVAAAGALTATPPAGPSTLGGLLQLQFGAKDTASQQQFAELLVRYGDDPTTLWAETGKAFSSTVASQLQLLGQLAYLTANNAPLISALYKATKNQPLASPADLVTGGYYQASAWEPLLDNVPVPSGLAGDTAADQQASYAGFLAAQVRLSYPTATVGQMAASGAFGEEASSSGAGAFLLANGEFDIGDEPVQQYLDRAGTSASSDVVAQVGRIQRVYQITEDPTSLGALLSAGLDSAYAVTRLAESEFVAGYADSLGGADVAQRVYTRAGIVHASTLHVALSYLMARRQPSIGSGVIGSVISGLGEGSAQTTHAQATLESLFGDLDYCQCDDCGSITSPAAYMVDLLDWVNNPTPTAPAQNPRDVLLGRRPDIGALPLTCDNTNTALPYIDLANEVLEYYVGNAPPNAESLTGFVGYSDDGTVSSAELIASPQNDDNAVAEAAYTTLKGQFYPPPLPFYRDLELLRQHIARFGIGLYDLMLAMRTSDGLEAPAATASDPNPYGWRDILLERLGISRLEEQLLTDSTLGLAQIYGEGNMTALASLQEYSRVTGVAYTDIVSILQTGFVNSAAWTIPLLDALAVPFSTLQALQDGTITPAQFEQQLPTGLDVADYGADGPAAWVTSNFAAISGLVVIDVAGEPCDTSTMALQHLDGSALAEIDFVRLLRFIRLWQKLGLAIQQTDDLISALYVSTAPGGATDLQQLDSGFSNLLLRAGIAYQAIDLLGLDPSADLESLLACWAPIATTGQSSPYAQMFLNPTVLRLDPAFAPDVNGELFTATPTPTVLAHQPAIMAALNLTSGEFDLITGPTPPGLGYDETTPLSLAAVSDIYRRAWLARTLGLSVLELLSLIAYTGVDPFAPPVLDDTDPVSSPFLDFLTRAQALDTAGLTPTQVLYLLWNIDLSGVSAPSPTVTSGLASALRSAFAAIDSQFSVGGSVTAATAQSLMSLVLGSTAAGIYFGLINNTFTTTVSFGYTQSTLPAAVLTAAAGRLSYDDLAKQLSFSGYLDPTTLSGLQSAATGDSTLLGGLTALSTANAQAVSSFFSTYDDPHTQYLEPLFQAYVTATTGSSPTDPGTALAALLNGLLPVLGNLRKEEQALACATAAAGCDPSFAPALLEAAGAIPAADPGVTAAGIADLTALDQGGLSVEYFRTDNPAAAPDQSLDVVPSLSYGPSNPLPKPKSPSTTIAAVWKGFISAAQDGDYNLSFGVDTGATVTLTVDGEAVPLASTSGATGLVWANTAAIPLQAGGLTPIEITATGLVAAFEAQWETVGVGWQPLPAQNLYSDVLLAYLQTTTLRFLKATALASDLSLNAAEIAYLATSADLDVEGSGWLAGLSVDAPADPPAYTDLTAVLDGLCTYATMKAAYSPLGTDTPQLLTTLEDTVAGAPIAASELLSLTGWDPVSLQPLLGRLFGVATNVPVATSLADFAALPGLLANLVRLRQAFAIVKTCGLSASTLIEAATNDPTPTPASTVLADFQSAVRSRYAEADWLTVVEPINDTLREKQRDALVAYILVQSGPAILADLGIAATPNRLPTADDLFNYFLLDVETEPCMLTSRVRLALSSIQLFVERCLRNLEPSVDPADIQGSQWDWRKRYRVWQANREVFLWPENWLDETLRDDQSPFFKTTMSQLLQSDIDDDAAVSAYLDYLSNLELVAKLDPCALYYDPVAETAHVLARTGGAHRKHYYRRFENGSWTPWEEVKLNIEDVPVALYVWNGRLLVFWLQLHYQSSSPDDLGQNMPKSPSSNPNQNLAGTTITQLSSSIGDSAPKMTTQQVNAALYFSEYYNGAWQPTKSSDVNKPLNLGTFQHGDFDRTSWSLRPWVPADPTDDSLYVQVTNDPMPTIEGFEYSGYYGIFRVGWTGGGTGFVLHNTHSEPIAWSDVPATTVTTSQYIAEVGTDGSTQTLSVTYASPGILGLLRSHDVTVLTGQLPQRIVCAQPGVQDQSTMPFFFGDSRGSFYVKPWQGWVGINRYNGFGLTAIASLGSLGDIAANAIPSLVVPFGPPQPDPPLEVSASGIDASIAGGAVSSGALRAVIGGGTNITFQGRSIGVNGSVALGQAANADGDLAEARGQ
jgi:Neuraminidase-like domain/Salmonella virulence plasmid 28.1kDa A protein